MRRRPSPSTTTVTSTLEVSRVTILEESDEEYISTVEDNSHITEALTTPVFATIQHDISTFRETICSSSFSHNITQNDSTSHDVTECLSMREMRTSSRRANVQKLSMVNNTPEMTPLLLRVNQIQRAKTATITGARVSTPIQVAHFVQAKKHIVEPQIVFSLETPLLCYEIVPSYGVQVAERQFILTPVVQKIKMLVLPAKQKVKMGTLPRKTSVTKLLLPPEGPIEAKILQPLWNTVTFTIAFGKHVAVEYNIPQVPVRRIKEYKAEKHQIKNINAATLYRDTSKENVVLCKAAPVHQLRLSTVELQDPQLVQIIRVEQNREETNKKSSDVHLAASTVTASTHQVIHKM